MCILHSQSSNEFTVDKLEWLIIDANSSPLPQTRYAKEKETKGKPLKSTMS